MNINLILQLFALFMIVLAGPAVVVLLSLNKGNL